tara:strand:- start:1481 stop:1828 length:348 start_codon:yes stop_codon:yes gene_type:complete
MANEVKIQKKVYDPKTFNKVVDRNFKTYAQKPDPVLETTVEDFFILYEELFYEIPIEGEATSHRYLVEKSSEIVNFEKDNDEIQPLLDEITILREQNLQLNQQLLDERINAAENP